MSSTLRIMLIAVLLTLGLALPALADDAPVVDPQQDPSASTLYVYDDGTAVYYTRINVDGSVQQWVYVYADGAEGEEGLPAGTAQHLILIPEALYDPLADWGDPVAVDLDGDGVADGTYYVNANNIAPMAVLAKLKGTELEDETLRYLLEMAKPGRTPGWLAAPAGDGAAEPADAQHGRSADAPGQQNMAGDTTRQQDRDQDQDCTDCDGDADQLRDQARDQDQLCTDCDGDADQLRDQARDQDQLCTDCDGDADQLQDQARDQDHAGTPAEHSNAGGNSAGESAGSDGNRAGESSAGGSSNSGGGNGR